MTGRRFFLALLGIAALIHGCMYSDYGHHFVEPVAGDPPVLSVATNLDTVINPEVIDSLEVIYEIDIQDGKLYYLDALVGNFLVYDSDTTRGSFWLYPDDVEIPGIDTLKLNMYYSSNTNSLGDLLGVEYLNTSLNYAIDFKGNSE